MSTTKLIPGPGGRSYTHGEDRYGEFGSLVRPESDEEIPPPLDFGPTGELESRLRASEAEEDRAPGANA